MERVDIMIRQLVAKLGGNSCGHQIARLRVIIQAFIQPVQPVRQACAAKGRNAFQAIKIGLQHDSRNDRHGHTALARPVPKAQECIRLEEEL